MAKALSEQSSLKYMALHLKDLPHQLLIIHYLQELTTQIVFNLREIKSTCRICECGMELWLYLFRLQLSCVFLACKHWVFSIRELSTALPSFALDPVTSKFHINIWCCFSSSLPIPWLDCAFRFWCVLCPTPWTCFHTSLPPSTHKVPLMLLIFLQCVT